MPVVAAISPPALADFAGFKASARVWLDIPYGPASWPEPSLGGQVLHQALDIELPPGTAPATGWPVVAYYHSNGGTKTVQNGLLATAKAEILAAGFAFVAVEFRHPVVNVDQGAPHCDVGLATQYVRAMAGAFGLDKANVMALCHSRGSLALWQGLQPDMANPNAPTYAGRQSSTLKAIWAYNPQTTYDTEQFSELYVLDADVEAFLVDHPNDARWGSAITSAAAAPAYPLLALACEKPYYGSKQSARVADDVHYPDMVASLRDAYASAWQGLKVTDTPARPDSEKYAGAAAWFRSAV